MANIATYNSISNAKITIVYFRGSIRVYFYIYKLRDIAPQINLERNFFASVLNFFSSI